MMSRSSDISNKLSASRDSLDIARVLRSSPLSEKPGLSSKGKSINFGSGPDPVQETKHLKGLILANIDLVQHQREILMAKDKTIQSLRKENEMMKSRLERIERRMMLVQQREQQHKKTPGSDEEHRPAKRSRRSNQADVLQGAVTDEMVSDSSSNPHDISLISSGKRQSAVKRLKTEPAEETKTFIPSSDDRKPPFLSVEPGAAAAAAAGVRSVITDCESRSRSYARRVCKASQVLTTDTPYYVQPLTSYVTSDDEDVNQEVKKKPVEVPSWRYNIVHGKYVIEGTENLDDHVFLKRHQKPENEEKKRKRWDNQRQRDLQLLHKYQPQDQKQREEADCARHDPLTFQPDIEKASRILGLKELTARFIEVLDTLPVTVFGAPLPNLEQREFSLSWLDDESSSKSLRKDKYKKS